MQTILIPADFKAVPYKDLSILCNRFGGEEIRLLFVHMFKLSDSETDLLMLARRSREYEQVSDEFYDGCKELKKKHPQIKEIKIEFLYGSTLGMFKNFLDTHLVNMVLNINGSYAGKINKASIDPAVLIKKSGLPIITINVADYEQATVTQPGGKMLELEEVVVV